jgi:hypothetical protein
VRREATLLGDRGEAALSDEFFRSREFLDAEGATHTLRVGDLAIPLVVREDLPEGARDAISPYGYPGASGPDASRPAPIEPAEIDWSATGLVSAFIRDRIRGEPALAGATMRSVVQVHDPERPRGVRSRLAEQIRQNERGGWSVEALSGPYSTAEQRRAFLGAYTQTMTRAGAAERYFFDARYFDRILAFERTWLLLATDVAGDTGAGAIAALSDGLLHYYLGGTADAHREASPFKNVASAMLDLADELGLPLNLGGGVRSGDGLERFKRGFANAELPFRTHELICDPPTYERLSEGRDAGGFFPAYRASRG